MKLSLKSLDERISNICDMIFSRAPKEHEHYHAHPCAWGTIVTFGFLMYIFMGYMYFYQMKRISELAQQNQTSILKITDNQTIVRCGDCKCLIRECDAANKYYATEYESVEVKGKIYQRKKLREIDSYLYHSFSAAKADLEKVGLIHKCFCQRCKPEEK